MMNFHMSTWLQFILNQELYQTLPVTTSSVEQEQEHQEQTQHPDALFIRPVYSEQHGPFSAFLF